MSETRITMFEAIARKQTIVARYNGGDLKLAPHLVFERHGDLFISALNLGKEWRSDEEPRLGQYKLAGLSATKLLDTTFDPLPAFDGAAPRADDVVLLTV